MTGSWEGPQETAAVTIARIYEYGGTGRAKGWGVFIDGRLVSDHSTIDAARKTAIRHQGGNPA